MIRTYRKLALLAIIAALPLAAQTPDSQVSFKVEILQAAGGAANAATSATRYGRAPKVEQKRPSSVPFCSKSEHKTNKQQTPTSQQKFFTKRASNHNHIHGPRPSGGIEHGRDTTITTDATFYFLVFQ